MACSENEVKDYLQRHNIKQVMETLSSLLLSHRPDQPWRFLSNSLSYAIQAEQSLPSSKKGQVTFNDLLQQSVPLPPTHHGDGRPITPLESRHDHLQAYLEYHSVWTFFAEAMEGLILANLPADPKKALQEYFSAVADSMES